MNFNILCIFLDFMWFIESIIFNVVNVLFKSMLNIQLLHLTLNLKIQKYIVNEILFKSVKFSSIHSFIILIIVFFCVDNY